MDNGLTKCSALLYDGQAGSTSVELNWTLKKDPENAVIFPTSAVQQTTELVLACILNGYPLYCLYPLASRAVAVLVKTPLLRLRSVFK